VDLASLSHRDLLRLRRVVRRVRMHYYPSELCTDAEADRIIETIGEQTAQRMMKALVDGKLKDGKLGR
jgi:hypothetical protein